MLRRLKGLMAGAPQAILCLLTAAAALVFLAGMFGGFDFTDEGSYYLSFVHPENVTDNHTSYYIFGGKLFGLLGHSIVALRVCTLGATFGGTLILLGGWRRFLRQFSPALLPDPERWRLMSGTALIASFLGYAISPPAFSYNFQNAFCLLAAAGFLLRACAQPRTPGWIDPATLGLLTGFGVLVGLEFFVKFSSSVVFAAGGSLLFLIVSPKSPAQKAALGALLLVCLAATGIVYFSLFQSFGPWWHGIFSTAQAVTTTSYALVQLERYSAEILPVLIQSLVDFIPVWAVALPALLVVAALRRRPRWQRSTAAVAGWAVLGTALWVAISHDYFDVIGRDGLPLFIGTLALVFVLATASGMAVRDQAKTATAGHWRVCLAGSFLLFLPYIGAFGTSNNINTNCLYQMAPWLVLTGGLLVSLDRTWQSAWPSRFGLVLLALVASGEFLNGYWMQPYRVAGGARHHQTVPTPIGTPASTLRLTPETHDFILKARTILAEHGFKPGDDLLVFFDLPGFVFAMGGVSPGHPWYFAGDKVSLDEDAMRLNFIEPSRKQRAFIVRNSLDPDWNDFLPRLRATGLNFPEDYLRISPPMLSPFTRVTFEIWQPKVRAEAP